MKHEDRLPKTGVLNAETDDCPSSLQTFRMSTEAISFTKLPSFFVIETSLRSDRLEQCFRKNEGGAFDYIRLKDSGTWHLMNALRIHPRRVARIDNADVLLLDAMIELSYNVGDCDGTTPVSRQKTVSDRVRTVLRDRQLPIIVPCVATSCVKVGQ